MSAPSLPIDPRFGTGHKHAFGRCASHKGAVERLREDGGVYVVERGTMMNQALARWRSKIRALGNGSRSRCGWTIRDPEGARAGILLSGDDFVARATGEGNEPRQ
jgi:hypothetical protein